MNEKGKTRGWVDAGSRILQKLLRSPRARTDIEIVLKNIDPEAAPDLTRTVMWTDPALALAALNQIPAALNVCTESLKTFLFELDTFPAELVDEVSAETISKLWASSVGEAAGKTVALLLDLTNKGRQTRHVLNEARRAMITGFERGLGDTPTNALVSLADRTATALERMVEEHPDAGTRLAEELGRVLREHPILVARALRPLDRALRKEIAS